MALWLVAALTAGLVLLHMIRPRFERRIISAARFFEGLPPARKGMPRLRLSSPVGSRPLYLQLPL
ncbi:MAG: BatA domain-containing protein, partial [Acidobacteriota bacterium]|nr:BatA domain-containing protein [Acidobacteriota bacterium]